MIYNQIINDATQQNKNILILSSPRTGTHVLGAELAAISTGICIGEICRTGYCNNFWGEFNDFANRRNLTIAQIVQLTPKLILAENVSLIKEKTIVVNIQRKNKVDQFASWLYFRVMDPTGLHGWHNHVEKNTRVTPNSITATELDINQFKIEQLVDNFFFPDYSLCYEDLTFDNQSVLKRNRFAFPLKEMFSNLDFVENSLVKWQYFKGYFHDNKK